LVTDPILHNLDLTTTWSSQKEANPFLSLMLTSAFNKTINIFNLLLCQGRVATWHIRANQLIHDLWYLDASFYRTPKFNCVMKVYMLKRSRKKSQYCKIKITVCVRAPTNVRSRGRNKVEFYKVDKPFWRTFLVRNWR